MKLLRFFTHETEGILMASSFAQEANAQPNACASLACVSACFAIVCIMVMYATYFSVCGAHDTGETSDDCA